MPVRTHCPHCGAAYALPEHQAGKRFTCKKCQQLFTFSPPARHKSEGPLDVVPVQSGAPKPARRPAPRDEAISGRAGKATPRPRDREPVAAASARKMPAREQ
jgi:predicted Zn finger-like uncharacterized protein